MYLGYVPLLTKGSFALYYGGEKILHLLSDKSASLVSPIIMGACMIFQLSFLIFKKIKLLKLSQKRTNSGMYLRNVFSTLLGGFSNTYTILVTVIFTASCVFFTVVHYLGIEARRSVNVKNEMFENEEVEDLEQIPSSIYFLGGIVFCLNIAQFMRNHALRKFARKKVKEFFLVGIRLSKYGTKSNKVVPFVINDNNEPKDPEKASGEDEVNDLGESSRNILRQYEAKYISPEAISKTKTESVNKRIKNENIMINENQNTRYARMSSIVLTEVEI